MDVWAMIAAERRLLADTMDQLSADRWTTPSLCAGWTVRDVAGHLITPFAANPIRFASAFVSNRLSIDKTINALSLVQSKRPTAEIAQVLRDNATHHFTPPLAGPPAPLTDALVHGQDFRRPLEIEYDPPVDRTRVVLDFLTGPRTVGFVPKGRLEGLRFSASDQDWSAGDGAALHGASIDLALAITGRPSGLDRLEGDGVAVLRSRLG
jgi:uncharacterized protein (TIGR03083 family)